MKKESQISRAIEILKINPTISVKDMATQMDLPIKRIYVIRTQAKIRMAEGTTKTRRILKEKHTNANLEAENKKLTDWCLMWKKKYDKLEQDYTQAKIMFLNSEAVVQYLENRIEKLLSAN